MKSCYEILEVSESASAEQIRSAYLKMAREYHPDRVPEHLTKLRADAEDKFKQVQGAWAVLGDAAKRGAAFTASPCTSGPGRHSGPSPPQAGLGVRWTLLVLIATLVLSSSAKWPFPASPPIVQIQQPPRLRNRPKKEPATLMNSMFLPAISRHGIARAARV